MSHGILYLHNHSALERDLKYKKNKVLVDTRFEQMFEQRGIKTHMVRYYNQFYLEIDTLDFVNCGGIFKNLQS